MTNVEIKEYKDNKWETLAKIGSIVTIQKINEPTMIDAGIVPGMEGVVVNFEPVNLYLGKKLIETLTLLEVFINEKHLSFFFRLEQLQVTRV